MAAQARHQLNMLAGTQAEELNSAQQRIDPVNSGGRELFQARFTGLSSGKAHAACKKFKGLATGCRVISPSQ